jgi:hypothetical protein
MTTDHSKATRRQEVSNASLRELQCLEEVQRPAVRQRDN